MDSKSPVLPDLRLFRAYSRAGDAHGHKERRFVIAAAIIVPVICSLGIYFIRHLPAGSAAETQGSVVNVQIMPQAVSSFQMEGADTPRNKIAAEDVPETPVSETAERFALVPEASSEPPPPSAMKAPTARNAAVEAFMRQLSDHIRPYQHYPEDALLRGMSGTVTVQFVLERNGAVQAIHVVTSSGHAVLDKAAIAAIMRAQPLPEIPSELADRFVVNLPMDYGLL